MVSNLLVVLCGNRDAQPVVRTGKVDILEPRRKVPSSASRSCVSA